MGWNSFQISTQLSKSLLALLILGYHCKYNEIALQISTFPLVLQLVRTVGFFLCVRLLSVLRGHAVFSIPATTANDLRLQRIFYPRFYPLHLFFYLNS